MWKRTNLPEPLPEPLPLGGLGFHSSPRQRSLAICPWEHTFAGNCCAGLCTNAEVPIRDTFLQAPLCERTPLLSNHMLNQNLLSLATHTRKRRIPSHCARVQFRMVESVFFLLLSDSITLHTGWYWIDTRSKPFPVQEVWGGKKRDTEYPPQSPALRSKWPVQRKPQRTLLLLPVHIID